GRTIGGDPFFNREKRLPEKAGRRWFEADLDAQCARRGAHRLVFSGDGLVFVTTDHYRTFLEVPK
ncbi:MAG: ribonuclease, partial [Alphaproteobacteria bacterium]|nr:ribonuclease [Alphaproteobacteria bacterium]